MTESNNTVLTLVQCPACKAELEWTQENPNRPFCSERCRNLDFVAWANEENIVPGNPVYDDVLSEELM